jgi:hypothetical protein
MNWWQTVCSVLVFQFQRRDAAATFSLKAHGRPDAKLLQALCAAPFRNLPGLPDLPYQDGFSSRVSIFS